MIPVGDIHPKSEFVLGVDFARMGEDSTILLVLEKRWDEEYYFVSFIKEMNKTKLTEVIKYVKWLNYKLNFKKIYLDETGLGAGPTDVLKEEMGSWKVESIYFTQKSKQDIYSNLKVLMQQGKIKFPEHKKLKAQLLDMRYEKTGEQDNIKIHHSPRGHDDYCDALALAAWHYRPQQRSGGYYIG